MINYQKFQFINIISIQPFILQDQMKVRESSQCLQIIAKYLNKYQDCPSEYVTRILKASRHELYNDDRDGIITRFSDLVNKPFLDTYYNQDLDIFRRIDVNTIIKWISDQKSEELREWFICLIDIVQILINNLGQYEVIFYQENWIKSLLIDSPSYIIIKEIFQEQMSKKAQKSLLYQHFINNENEFIQDKQTGYQKQLQDKVDDLLQIQHMEEIDYLQKKIDDTEKERKILKQKNEELQKQLFDYQINQVELIECKQELQEIQVAYSELKQEMMQLKQQTKPIKIQENDENEDTQMNRSHWQFEQLKIGRQSQVPEQLPQRRDSQNKHLKRQPQLPIKNSPIKIDLSKRVGVYEKTLIGLVEKKN